MLNNQPWSRPVTMESHNLSMRLEHAFSDAWRGAISASRSRAIIDDNVAFPYGCYMLSSCDPSVPGATHGQYFASDGSYDVYDYRSPGDKRRNDQLLATISGNIGSGFIRHEVTFGASLFRRTVDLRESVFDWVGTDNIYNATPLQFAPVTRDAGPSYRALDSRQRAVFVQDRIRIGEQWQVVGGARQVWLKEQTPTHETTRNELLPQLALIYQPAPAWSLYGSYSKGLSLGGQAPAWTTNAYAFLSPTVSRQWEAGARYDWRDALTLGLTAFRLTKPFEYAQPDASASGSTFVQQGQQIHTGLELSATGRVTPRLQLSASATALRAKQRNTGTPAFDGQQAINTPRFRSAIFADYHIPGVEGLAALGGWSYTSSKYATRDGLVAIPAVHRFDVGLRYATRLGASRATFILMVDNVFDKRYWKDAGETLGDGYLHRGAPRTARLTARFSF
jgi:iron complex outermembrane receptor protein